MRKFSVLVVVFSSILPIQLLAQTGAWGKVPDYPEGCWLAQSNDEKIFNDAGIRLGEEAAKQLEINNAEREKFDNLSAAEKARAGMAVMQKQMSNVKDPAKYQQDLMTHSEEAGTESARLDESYDRIRAQYRAEIESRLDPLLQQMPQGTSNQDLMKRRALSDQYNAEYELICARYFGKETSVFPSWLTKYRAYLQNYEIPDQEDLDEARAEEIKEALGSTSYSSIAELHGVGKFINRVNEIYGSRLLEPIGH